MTTKKHMLTFIIQKLITTREARSCIKKNNRRRAQEKLGMVLTKNLLALQIHHRLGSQWQSSPTHRGQIQNAHMLAHQLAGITRYQESLEK